MKSFSCFKPKDPFRLWSKELDKRVAIWAKNFNSSFKLLLLGPAGAGKTTILKQIKIIHFEGFSVEERQQKAKEIRTNLLESVRELTACITASGKEISWGDPENQTNLEFINNLNLDDQTYELYAAKIYDYSKRILNDKGVRDIFEQLNQLSITHRSQYLLNRVDEIRNVNYLPNNDDILHSRRRTSDIQKLEFQVNFPVKSGQTQFQQTFSMFDVGGQRGERRKWIQVFDGVSAVMFLIDSSSFDAVDEENGRNKLHESLKLFYEVWTTRFLLSSNFVLLFNKQDILREKIERGISLEDHFPEYRTYTYKHHSQDRALLSKAGEKLNLFRYSKRSSRTVNAKAAAAAFASSYKSSIGRASGGKAKSTSLHEADLSNAVGTHKLSTRSTHSELHQASLSSLSTDPTSSAIDRNSSQLRHSPNQSRASKSNESVAALAAAAPTRRDKSPEEAYHRARAFIRDKFLHITRQSDANTRKYSTPNINMYNNSKCSVDQPKRTVCYHYTTATDTENIRDLFENLQKMMIKSLKDRQRG